MHTEKRKHPRIEVKQLVEMDLGREFFLRADALNLSRGGLLCRTEEACDSGVQVFLMMTVSLKHHDRIIKAQGTVARCVPHGKKFDVGISLSEMDAASRKIFDAFLLENHG